MSQNSNMTDDTIDLKELFFSLIAQWKVILLCVILSIICAVIYLRITTPIYSTDAMVQVEDSKSAASAALLGNLSNAIPGGLGTQSPADAEIEILKSRMVLGKVIQNLNLDIHIQNNQDTLLNRLIEPNDHQVIYKNNLVIFKNDTSEFIIKKLDVPAYYRDQPLQLNFSPEHKFTLSHNGHIVFTGETNKANIKNDQFGNWNIELFTKATFKQSFTVKKLSLPTAVSLVRSQYGVSEKGQKSGVIALSYNGTDKEHITHVLNNILSVYQSQNVERKSLESKQTLNFLDKQLPDLKKQLEASEIKFNQFREKYNTVDVTQESELLLKQNVELAKMKIELQQQQAELASKYTNDHPLMVAVNSQLAEIDKKTSEMTQTIKKLPETQRLYLQLYRDVKVNTELYTALLNSYQQLKISEAGEIGNVRIIDQAIEPVEPIKPRSLIVLILSLLIGGFIGVLIALIRNLLKSGIKNALQLEREFSLPVYATVPRSPLQENRIRLLRKKKSIPILAVNHGHDIAVESLRSMRTAIHFVFNSAKNNLIMISGPAPEVGRSFISTNLATVLTQAGSRVIIIDADLRRGYIHKYFNLDIQPGLSDYLSAGQALDSVIRQTNVPNLSVISRGKSPTNPSELLGSENFKDMLTQLSEQFDYVIIDTPPVLAVTDGIIISQYTGVNIVVARHSKTQIKELEITLNRFEQAGSKVDGFILNDIQRNVGDSYGYKYHYAYKASNDNE